MPNRECWVCGGWAASAMEPYGPWWGEICSNPSSEPTGGRAPSSETLEVAKTQGGDCLSLHGLAPTPTCPFHTSTWSPVCSFARTASTTGQEHSCGILSASTVTAQTPSPGQRNQLAAAR